MKKILLLALAAGVTILVGSYAIYVPHSNQTPLLVTKSTTYICKGNKIIGAKFYLQPDSQQTNISENEPPTPTGSVDITLSDGRSMHLTQTISGSGTRYANHDESFIFWTKGTGVIILEDNEEKNFIDCEEKKRTPSTISASTTKFLYDTRDFSIILPRFTVPPELARTDSYTVDENHSYGLVPGESIKGVKFTIPSSVTQGTNLSKDTYISTEFIKNAKSCSADIFFEENVYPKTIRENGILYSVASTTGAAAGNRYEETIYATKGRNTCVAIRYYIHYSLFENYPRSTVKEFNMRALRSDFDSIRKSLTIKN